jgi:hypothetical protein
MENMPLTSSPQGYQEKAKHPLLYVLMHNLQQIQYNLHELSSFHVPGTMLRDE